MARMMVVGLAALAFCCWAVQLGGVASLNASCSDADESLANYLAANGMSENAYFQSGNGLFGATMLPSDRSISSQCGRIFSFQWWVVIAELLIILFLVPTSMSNDFMHGTRVAWVGCLSVLTTLNWLYAARYNITVWNMADLTDEDTLGAVYTRTQVAYAGYVMVGVANVLLMFAMSGIKRQYVMGNNQQPRQGNVGKEVAGGEAAV